MAKIKDYKLVLSSGETFEGVSFGARVERVCELVFNTSMAGYQEIISEPSYYGQAVVMTYPVIGNYGIADEDFGSKVLTVSGLIVRDYTEAPSNFLCTKTLEEVLEDNGIPAIYGVDTRRLAKIIRDNGTCKAIITPVETPVKECLERIQNAAEPEGMVGKVSCRKRWFSRTAHAKYTVVAVDCGIKRGTVKCLNDRGCNVIVVPYNTTKEEIDHLEPDGILISNGPGNPKDVPETVELIKSLVGHYPVYGICLGHQLVALAYGGDTYKMKFGHRGGYPVKNLNSERISITSQNHGYAVDGESLKASRIRVSHESLMDGSVEALECAEDKVYTSQYFSENAPGPHDECKAFDKLISLMEERRNA